MSEHTVLGMPLRIKPDGRLANGQPLCALVVVKFLDEEGKIFYMTLATTDLHAMVVLPNLQEEAACKIRGTS